MTDLPIYPDSYLPSPIVAKEKIDNGWSICVLEDGQFIYFDYVGYFWPISEERLKWQKNKYANMESQEGVDIARYVDSRNLLSPQSIDLLLQFMAKHKKPAA